MQDPIFGNAPPDLQELRAAVDHAPRLVGHFLQLYHSHRTTLEKMMQLGSERLPAGLLASSPDTIIHDFFRDHPNHFPAPAAAAEQLHAAPPAQLGTILGVLKEHQNSAVE